MMKGRLAYWIVSALLSLSCFSAFSQGVEQLMMYRTFGGAEFEYTKDTVTFDVSPRQVLQIMKKNDPLAYEEFKKARGNNTVASIMGFVGGGLIAFPLGTAIIGGQPEWELAAAGAVIVVASIPFARAYKRHSQSAVDTFNKNHTAFKPRAEYFLAGLGVRVVIKF